MLDPGLNAFRVTLAEEALAEADAGRPSRTGPLAGVPIAVKDDSPVAGQPMTRRIALAGAAGEADGEVSGGCALPVRSRSGSPTCPS